MKNCGRCANVGGADRMVRFLVGAALVASPYVFPDWALWQDHTWRWVIPVVGVVVFLSALFRFCGLYRLIGVNTYKTGGQGGACCAKKDEAAKKSCCGGKEGHDHHHDHSHSPTDDTGEKK